MPDDNKEIQELLNLAHEFSPEGDSHNIHRALGYIYRLEEFLEQACGEIQYNFDAFHYPALHAWYVARRAARANRRERLKKSAASKLTPEEREALNLPDPKE